jgi:hypothetical protein
MPHSRLIRLAVMLPPALLVTVASVQIVFALTANLSPWKGGGFGMFATLAGLPFRETRIFVDAADRSEELAIPASLEDAAARAATFPHERSLRRLAAAVIARERRLGRPVETVRLEVWRAEFTPTLMSTRVKLRELTVRVDETTAATRR